MRLLSWLIRFIILTLIANMIVRFFSSRRREPAAARGGGRQMREREGGTLVRDPQCGTYIPRARALQIGAGDAAQYFCSDSCRTAWAAAHPS